MRVSHGTAYRPRSLSASSTATVATHKLAFEGLSLPILSIHLLTLQLQLLKGKGLHWYPHPLSAFARNSLLSVSSTATLPLKTDLQRFVIATSCCTLANTPSSRHRLTLVHPLSASTLPLTNPILGGFSVRVIFCQSLLDAC
jgi:hypothetical protein